MIYCHEIKPKIVFTGKGRGRKQNKNESLIFPSILWYIKSLDYVLEE
jgi:hypothetical protein